MNKRWLAPAGLAAAVLVTACGSSTTTGSGATSGAAAPASSAPAASSSALKTGKIGAAVVLTVPRTGRP